MELLKKGYGVLLSFVIIGGVFYGLRQTIHSPLFTVQAVEVQDVPESIPIDKQTIVRLASIPIGKMSLFELDLKQAEHRLLTNEWVKEVNLQKRLPHTVSISISYRKPVAILQGSKGNLTYLDENGKGFAAVQLANTFDLPVLSGFQNQSPEKIRDALKLISQWESLHINRFTLISTVFWEVERGYRLLVAYSAREKINDAEPGSGFHVRTMIDLGHEIEANLSERLLQLNDVFQYLAGNHVMARYIWADASKKVVVKTVLGS